MGYRSYLNEQKVVQASVDGDDLERLFRQPDRHGDRLDELWGFER